MIQTTEDFLRALSQAKKGETIVLAKGVFLLPCVDIPAGVSIVGQGSRKTTLKFSEMRWWRGCLDFTSQRTEKSNQRLEGVRLDGQKKSFNGVYINNRTDITILDVVCRGFYNSAITVNGSHNEQAANIEIAHFDILNCSRENSDGALGNITLEGFLEGVVIRDGKIAHTSSSTIQPYSNKRSGGGIKIRPTWQGNTQHNGKVKYSKIQRIIFESKPIGSWNGDFAPNLNIEVCDSEAEELEISGCYLPSSMSLEHNAGNRTFHVHSNYFATQWGQSLELAAPHSIIERNVFDFRKNTNAWGVTGNYNSDAPIRNISFFENDFLLGHHTPHLYRTTARLDGFNFLRNKVFSEKEVVLLELETPNTAGCNNIIAEDNYFHAGYIPYSFTKDASVPPTGIFQ